MKRESPSSNISSGGNHRPNLNSSKWKGRISWHHFKSNGCLILELIYLSKIFLPSGSKWDLISKEFYSGAAPNWTWKWYSVSDKRFRIPLCLTVWGAIIRRREQNFLLNILYTRRNRVSCAWLNRVGDNWREVGQGEKEERKLYVR